MHFCMSYVKAFRGKEQQIVGVKQDKSLWMIISGSYKSVFQDILRD